MDKLKQIFLAIFSFLSVAAFVALFVTAAILAAPFICAFVMYLLWLAALGGR